MNDPTSTRAIGCRPARHGGNTGRIDRAAVRFSSQAKNRKGPNQSGVDQWSRTGLKTEAGSLAAGIRQQRNVAGKR